jgi:hypothetical protein
MRRFSILWLVAVLFAYNIFAHAQNIEYVSSTLWHHIYKTEVSGNYAYCLFENGLMIYDITNPENPSIFSQLYLQDGATDLTIVGNYIYLAVATGGLEIVDISNPGQPEIIGQWVGQYSAKTVSVSGNYAFLAEMTDLKVIDISNPTNPQLISSCRLSGNGYKIAVQGNYAYLAENYYGLEIFDISDPSNPHIHGYYAAYELNMGIAVRGEYAYLENDQLGLMIINISDPANPILTSTESSSFGENIALSGDYAFIPSFAGNLMIVNVADPQNPLHIGMYESLGKCGDVAISGSLACLASENYFEVIDISDLVNPSLLGYLVNGKVYGVCISGNYAYVAHDDLGVQIVDISNPELPIVLGCADTPFDIRRVTVSGNYVYASGLGYGFSTIDVTNPTEPNLIGENDLNGFIQDVLVYGNYLYVNDFSFGGLRIYDISNPLSPILAGTYQPSNYMINSHIKISDNWLYLTSSKFEILDITDPPNPILIGSIDGFLGGKAIDVTGNYAYAVLDTALSIIDISDRENPRLARSIWHMDLSDINISGDYMYLIGEAPGLKRYNISDRINPQLIASYYTAQPLLEIEMSQGDIYIAGLHSLFTLRFNPTDINDDSNPIPSSFFLTQNYPNPFNSTTMIQYDLPKTSNVALEILDILGRKVDVLVNAKQAAGHHTAVWDGKDYSSGIYFYRIQAGDFSETKKMLLLK